MSASKYDKYILIGRVGVSGDHTHPGLLKIYIYAPRDNLPKQTIARNKKPRRGLSVLFMSNTTLNEIHTRTGILIIMKKILIRINF